MPAGSAESKSSSRTHRRPNRQVITIPTTEQLQRRYRDAPDSEISDALKAGADAFNPDAWQIVAAEAQRRGISLDAAPATEAAPPPPTRTLSAEESAQVADGRAQARIVFIISAVVYGGLTLSALSWGGWTGFAQGGVKTVLVLAFCYFLMQGKAWARWSLVTWFALEGVARIVSALMSPAWLLPTIVNVGFGVIGVGFLAMSLALAFSPSVRALVAAKTAASD